MENPVVIKMTYVCNKNDEQRKTGNLYLLSDNNIDANEIKYGINNYSDKYFEKSLSEYKCHLSEIQISSTNFKPFK